MAIVLIVEDGSIVQNANCYVTVSEARVYALNRGVELSENDDTVAALIIKASDYLESFWPRYKGKKVSQVQSLAWPRKNVYIACELFPENEIPQNLKNAQCALVLSQHSGAELLKDYGPSDYVIKEKVGPIETQYSDFSKLGFSNTFETSDFYLTELLDSNKNPSRLKTIRV